MKRGLTLELRTFGLEALSRAAEGQNLPPETLVERAAQYYLSQEDSGRTSANVPRLAGAESETDREGSRPLSVTLDLEDWEWAALSKAAASNKVTLESLVKHAVFLLVGDLAQGRVAARMLGED